MIPFTQYKRPNGHRVEGGFDRPEAVEQKAYAFIEAGGAFSCEVLTTGQIMLYAEHNGEDIVLVEAPNGPGLMDKIDELVDQACTLLNLN